MQAGCCCPPVQQGILLASSTWCPRKHSLFFSPSCSPATWFSVCLSAWDYYFPYAGHDFFLVELYEVLGSPSCLHDKVPVDSSTTFCCSCCVSQCCVIYKLAEGPMLQVIKEDVNPSIQRHASDWPQAALFGSAGKLLSLAVHLVFTVLLSIPYFMGLSMMMLWHTASKALLESR